MSTCACRRVAHRVCLLLVTVVALAAGCSPFSSAGESFHDRHAGIRVSLPPGWLRYNGDRDRFAITRDGLRLERITLLVLPVGGKFPGTERTLSAGMLPLELAELSTGLLQSRESVKNLKIDHIRLASLAGRDGYRIDASFIDEHGLPMRLRIYGALIGKHFCEFQLAAAEPVYFDKYADDFERLVSSMRRDDRP